MFTSNYIPSVVNSQSEVRMGPIVTL